ncbi:MAG TPA: hypothetical protein VFG47_04850 [Geminicoccaceae bacterium]|nr:hypothetical protein [Geminicoccaceae bacterium]
MIEFVFRIFALEWVPWVLSALIVLAAVGIWVHFRLRLQPVLRGLDQAREVVCEVEGPAAFHDRFHAIHERLAANPVIGEGWRAYAPTLVPAPEQREGGQGDGAVGYTRRPAEHLDERLLASAGVNLRFYQAVPNLLVGCGLLFTFLGLVAALYFASHGVAAAEVAAAQEALRALLAAATFKFATSIAGLGASLVFSWREKAQLYQVGRRLHRLCAELEARMVPLTPEYLATIQLAELRQHGALLRRLGRNIHVTVPETIEDRLGAELIAAVRPLHAAFAEAAARIARLDQAALGRLAAPSVAALAAGSGTGWGDAATAGLEALLGELRALRRAIADLADRPLAPAVAAPEAAARHGAALASYRELFEESAAGIRALDAQLAAAVAQIERGIGELAATFPESDDPGGRLAPHRAALDASLAGLDEARRELNGLGRAFRAVAARSREILDARDTAGAAGASDLDSEVSRSLDRLGEGVRAFNDQVRGFVRRMDEALARSASLLGGVVRELRGADGGSGHGGGGGAGGGGGR